MTNICLLKIINIIDIKLMNHLLKALNIDIRVR